MKLIHINNNKSTTIAKSNCLLRLWETTVEIHTLGGLNHCLFI